MLEALSRTTTHSVGTLQYMSPEQIDAAAVDARADLYALGLMFYELLCGRPPFESASPRELLNMHCTAEPPALPDDVRAGLPKGIERLVFALLRKRPDERPSSAAEVIAALEPFSGGGRDGAHRGPAGDDGEDAGNGAASGGDPEERGHDRTHRARLGGAGDPDAAGRRVFIVVLSVLAGGVTYGVRALLVDDTPAAESE